MTLAFSSAKTASTTPRIAFAAVMVAIFASGAEAETTIVPSRPDVRANGRGLDGLRN
jgi:hypothetical protein